MTMAQLVPFPDFGKSFTISVRNLLAVMMLVTCLSVSLTALLIGSRVAQAEIPVQNIRGLTSAADEATQNLLDAQTKTLKPEDYDIDWCDFDRRSEISIEEFRRDYLEKKPLILSNVTDTWREKGAMFDLHLLKKHQGEVVVKCGFSAQFPLAGGNGYPRLTLHEYIEYLQTPELRNITGEEPLYAFDRGDFFRFAPYLQEEIKIPDALFHFNAETNLDLFFGVGAALTGVQFHSHNDAYNIIVQGKKLWLVYPPQQTPPFDYMSHKPLTQWIDDYLPLMTEEQKPKRCVQKAGELLYIPEGWFHAVLNLEDTVAMAGQIPRPQTHFSKSLAYAQQLRAEAARKKSNSHSQQRQSDSETGSEELRLASEILKSLMDSYPGCDSCAIELSRVYLDMEKFEECLKVRECSFDPCSDRGLTLTILGLLDPQVAEDFLNRNNRISFLWTSKGLSLHALGRLDEAIEAFSQAVSLNPHDAFSYSHLADIHMKKGNVEHFHETSRMSKSISDFQQQYMGALNYRQDLLKEALSVRSRT